MAICQISLPKLHDNIKLFIGQINGHFIVLSTNDSPRIVTFDGFDNKLRSSSWKIHLYIPASLERDFKLALWLADDLSVGVLLADSAIKQASVWKPSLILILIKKIFFQNQLTRLYRRWTICTKNNSGHFDHLIDDYIRNIILKDFQSPGSNRTDFR